LRALRRFALSDERQRVHEQRRIKGWGSIERCQFRAD
jgi:hypothetical protein